MAFCSKCGNHLEGKERFCVKCGTDLTATPPAETPPASVVPPVVPVAQYAFPPGYAAPGALPITVPMLVAAPKKLPWVWIILTLALAGAAAYYYHQAQTLQAEITKYKPLIDFLNDTSGKGGGKTDGGTSGTNTGSGGGSNGNNGGGGNTTQALLQQQIWHQTAWNLTNGAVIVQGTWQNNSTTTISNGTLTCREYDANSQELGTLTATLNGPIQSNMIYTYNTINIGSPASTLNKLGCDLTGLKI